MAEIKTKNIWSKTLLEMTVGEILDIPFDETNLVAASANYQKSKLLGLWKICTNRDLKTATVERLK